MAISKNTHNVGNKPKPEPVFETTHCDDKGHRRNHHHLHLWDDFSEAKKAVYDVHLNTGEVHTEFYKDATGYHCVVGVGNYDVDQYPLILTDSGVKDSVTDQITQLQKKIQTLNDKDAQAFKSIQSQVDKLVEKLNENAKAIDGKFDALDDEFSNLSTNLSKTVSDMYMEVHNIADQTAKTKGHVDKLTTKVNDLDSKLKSTKEQLQKNINTTDNNVKTVRDDLLRTTQELLSKIEKSGNDISHVMQDVQDINVDKIIQDINTLSETERNTQKGLQKTDATVSDIIKNIKKISEQLGAVASSAKQNSQNIDNLSKSTADTFQTFDAQLGTLADTLNSLSNALADTQKAQRQQRNEIKNTKQTLQDYVHQTDVLTKTIGNIETIGKNNTDRINKLEKKSEALDKSIQALDKTQVEASAQSKILSSKIDDLSEDNKLNKQNFADLVKSLAVIDSRIDQNDLSIKDNSDELDKLDKEVHHHHHNLMNLNDASQKTNERLAKIEGVLDSLLTNFDNQDVNVGDIQGEILSIKQKIKELLAEDETTMSKLTEHQQVIDEHNMDIAGLDTSLQKLWTSLEKLNHDYNDYVQATDTSLNVIYDDMARQDEVNKATQSDLNDIHETLIDVSTTLDAHADHITNLRNQQASTQSTIDELVNNVQICKEHLQYIDASINDLYSLSDAHQNHLVGVDSSLEYLFQCGEEVHQLILELDTSVVDLLNTVDAQSHALEALGLRVSDIENKDAEQDTVIKTIQQNIDDLYDRIDGNVDGQSKRFEAIDASLEYFMQCAEEVHQLIISVDSSLQDLYHIVELIDASVIDHEERVSTLEDKIKITDSLDASVIDHDDRLRQIESSLVEHDNIIDAIDASVFDLQEEMRTHHEEIAKLQEDLHNTNIHIDSSVSELRDYVDTSIVGLIDVLEGKHNDLNDKVDALNDKVDDIKAQTDASIIETNDKLDQAYATLDKKIDDVHDMLDTSIITDSSIQSLFSDDVYTVNLCCYTPAGRVEITDSIQTLNPKEGMYPGPWGDSRDLYPKTYGKYKTYVAGDDVSFYAEANRGYFFKEWLVNAQSINHTDPTITTQFVDKDINLNGTLWDGFDPDPVNSGYSALFERLLVLKTDTSLVNYTQADYKTGDELAVVGYYDGEPPYYAKGATINVTAVPLQKHRFLYYIVDDTTQIDNPRYAFMNALSDHKIVGYFEEIRYALHAELGVVENERHAPEDLGNINISSTYISQDSTYIDGADVILEAIPTKVDSRFVRWVYGDGSDENLKGQTYSEEPKIKVIVDHDIYLTALFQATI